MQTLTGQTFFFLALSSFCFQACPGAGVWGLGSAVRGVRALDGRRSGLDGHLLGTPSHSGLRSGLDGHSLGTPSHSLREPRRLFLGPPRPPVLLGRKSPSRSQERIPRPPAGSRACSGDAPRDHPPPGAGTKRTPGVTAPWGAAPHQPRAAGAETGGETGRPAQGFTPGSRPSWDSNPGPSCLSPPFPPPTPA